MHTHILGFPWESHTARTMCCIPRASCCLSQSSWLIHTKITLDFLQTHTWVGSGGGVVTLTRWQSSNSTQCFFLHHAQTQKNSSLNYKCLLGGGHFLNALKLSHCRRLLLNCNLKINIITRVRMSAVSEKQRKALKRRKSKRSITGSLGSKIRPIIHRQKKGFIYTKSRFNPFCV